MTLVQVLAIADPAKRNKALLHLCNLWEVKAVLVEKEKMADLDMSAIIPYLARAVILYHRF